MACFQPICINLGRAQISGKNKLSPAERFQAHAWVLLFRLLHYAFIPMLVFLIELQMFVFGLSARESTERVQKIIFIMTVDPYHRY